MTLSNKPDKKDRHIQDIPAKSSDSILPQPDIDDSWGGFRIVDSIAREVPGKVTITREELNALYQRLAAEAVDSSQPKYIFVDGEQVKNPLYGQVVPAVPLSKLKAIMEIKE